MNWVLVVVLVAQVGMALLARALIGDGSGSDCG